jgi:hypothetical protein
MKLRFAISGLALLAIPHFAHAATIQFEGAGNFQGGGSALAQQVQGSFTFDLATATIVQQSHPYEALYQTVDSTWEYTAADPSSSAHGVGPLSVLIDGNPDPKADQHLTIKTIYPGFSKPELALYLVGISPQQGLNGPGAPTFLDIHDWSDGFITASTDTLPQMPIGNWFMQDVSVAPTAVDEPGSLPILAAASLALVGLSQLRKVGEKFGTGQRKTVIAC